MKTILDRLLAVCRAYYDKLVQLENEKYDMEKEVEFKDFRVRPPPPPNHMFWLGLYTLYIVLRSHLSVSVAGWL